MMTAPRNGTARVEEEQAPPLEIEAVAARLSATLVDAGIREHRYRRGHEDGIAWASEYATGGRLGDLVANLKRGRDGTAGTGCGFADGHWHGFVDGAEEVLDTAAPLHGAAVAGDEPDGDEPDGDEPDGDFRYERGRCDGFTWARDFATAGELRDLVVHHEAIASGADDPHWRGFVEGAEEVLDAAGPLLGGPVPRALREPGR